MSGLRAATRDLHHAAEQHVVGAAMADGTISAAWWSQWLFALWQVHRVLDTHLPAELRRTDRLVEDFTLCEPHAGMYGSRAAAAYTATLTTPAAILGGVYTWTGAHLMGGEVMRRKLADRLPCAHLLWDDRRAAIETWRPWRDATGCEAEARVAFAAVLAIMDEVHS